MTDKVPASTITPGARQPLIVKLQCRRLKEVVSKPPATSQLGKPSSQFTQSQFALALTIQKSKPEDVSMSEYCEQLRKRIRIGQSIVNREHRYVDTYEFWKDQYTRIHLEKKALEDRVRQVEEAQRLVSDSQQDHHNLERIILSSTMNHKDMADISRKHQALFPEREDEDSLDVDSRIISESDISMNSQILQMAQQRIALDNLAQTKFNSHYVEDLLSHSSKLTDLIMKVLSNFCQSLCLEKSGKDSRREILLRLSMHQVDLSYRSCFNAMGHLCQNIAGRMRRFSVIQRLVMIFHEALHHLHTMSTFQAEHETEEWQVHHNRAGIETDGGGEMGGGKGRGGGQGRKHEYIVSRYLANALESIVLNIEWKVGQPGHKDVLEGILYCILERTGNLLSEVIFKEHVAASKAPGNMSETKRQTSSASRKRVETAAAAVNLESPYLIQVLRAAIGESISTADRKELIAGVLAGSSTVGCHENPLSGTFVFSGELLINAKKKLQATLVKSIIGESDGLTFTESLKLPDLPLADELYSGEPRVSGEYGPKWLTTMMWALVGWDLVVQND